MLRSLLLILILVTTIPSTCESTFAKSQEPPTDKEVIRWLPTDVETLVVARKPFQMPANPDRALRLQDLLTGPATDDPPGNSITLAVEACRDFKFPGGNGTNTDEGCHIYVFAKPPHMTPEKYAEKVIKIDGLDVYVSTTPVGFGSMPCYLAMPKKELIVLTSSERYMRTILRRMKEAPQDRAMPKTLAEWQFIPKNSAFYAIRHYEHQSEDPASPYSKYSDWQPSDRQAIGFAAAANEYDQDWLDFWYFSNSPEGVKFVEKRFTDYDKPGKAVEVKPLSNQSWHLRISSAGEGRRHVVLIHLMALLGHTPYF
ncbi:MAG: hypothetical protein AB7W16_20435 [Candidatus Obscuribacterales bacterium]